MHIPYMNGMVQKLRCAHFSLDDVLSISMIAFSYSFEIRNLQNLIELSKIVFIHMDLPGNLVRISPMYPLLVVKCD